MEIFRFTLRKPEKFPVYGMEILRFTIRKPEIFTVYVTYDQKFLKNTNFWLRMISKLNSRLSLWNFSVKSEYIYSQKNN